MNRKEFDNLNVEEQIEYINEKLHNGSTLTKVCNSIGIDRSTIRKRAKKVGQYYDSSLNQYVRDKSETTITSDSSKTKVSCDENKTIVPQDKGQAIINHRDNNSTLVTDKNVMKNLLELSKNHDKIMEVLTWFESDKGMSNVIEVTDGIKIDLPEEKDTEFRKTVRLNDTVWNLFSKFCKEHKEFKQKDLHSQALRDYIKKFN